MRHPLQPHALVEPKTEDVSVEPRNIFSRALTKVLTRLDVDHCGDLGRGETGNSRCEVYAAMQVKLLIVHWTDCGGGLAKRRVCPFPTTLDNLEQTWHK